MKPNPQCDNTHCVQKQLLYQEQLASRPAQVTKESKPDEKIIHETNEWGISLVEESAEDTTDAVISEGLKYEYSPPTHPQLVATNAKPDTTSGPSVDELMQQLKNL